MVKPRIVVTITGIQDEWIAGEYDKMMRIDRGNRKSFCYNRFKSI